MRRLAVILLATAGAFATLGAGVASADDQVNVDGLFQGNYNDNVAPSLLLWNSQHNNEQGNPNTSPPAQFLIDAQTDLGYGTTPFTCPSSPSVPGCGYLTAHSVYALNFNPDTAVDSNGDGILAGDTVTFQAPAGTVFPDPTTNLGDYVVASQCNDPQNNPSAVPQDFVSCQNGAFEASAVQRLAPNKVVVTMPIPVGDTDHATIFIADVANPPEGTYSNLDYPVTTTVQRTFGYPPSGGSQIFGNAGPFEPNSGLVAATDRLQVSKTNAVTLTATVRDLYGNGVGGESVFIEPSIGSATATQIQTQTADDGTVSDQFIDTTAEPNVFRALESSAGFVILQDAMVTFTPGPPDASHSQITVAPCSASSCLSTTVPADGSPTAVVTVDLADQFGNPTIQPENTDTGAAATGDQVVLQPQLTAGSTFPFVDGAITPINGAACNTPPIIAAAGCTNTKTTIEVNGSPQAAAEAQFKVSDTTAENVEFEIEDLTLGEDVTAASLSPTIDFVAGPPADARSTITGPSQPIAADGTASGTITVTLVDKNGNPVPGMQVALVQSAGAHAQVTSSTVPTDGHGQAVFRVSDTVIETPSFTATYSGTVSGQPVSGTVPPSGEGPTVDFVAGGTSGSKSTAIASPASVLANGTASSTVTVSLVDGQGNVAAGRHVSLTQSTGEHSTITPAAATTDSGGVARFTVTDTSLETVTYTATDMTDGATLTEQPSVSFTSTPSVGKTTVSAAPAAVPADGATASTVTVTLLDSNGLPIAGKQLCLPQATGLVPSSGPCSAGGSGPSTTTPQQISDSGSGCAAQSQAGTTDCHGHAAFTVTAATAETVTYGVIDLTDYPSGPALGPHASVTFSQPTSEAGLSSVTASPTQVLANTPGAAGTSTVTVTLIVPGGSPMAGHNVGLGTSSSSSTVTSVEIPDSDSGCATQAAAGVSDCNGQTQFAVTDTAVESVTYTATDLSASPTVKVAEHATVVFVPNEAAASTVKADSATATADGGATTAGKDDVTVTLNPTQPLSGDHVSLSQASGAASTISAVQIPDSSSGCSTQAAAGTSDCNGQTRFDVTDTTAESVTYTAHDESTGVTLDQKATVGYIPPPPVISTLTPDAGPVAGGTRVTIAGTSLFVEGRTPAVTFAGRAASNVSCPSSSSCIVTAPAASGPGVVSVVLTTPVGASTPAASGGNLFEYLAAAPTLTKVRPSSGPKAGGTTVIITGANFATVSATTVRFGTATVKPASVNAAGTQLTVVSPAETAGTVSVTVTTPAGTSKKSTAARFTYGGLLGGL